ncbi:MAG: PLP-dependent aminotransferase family protein [Rhodospirillaceae bacterium]|nr:PLP-dependent aminotransferase family protein [Rhodospirillaceae bacterium]
MTILQIELENRPGPKYRAIATALAECIEDGRLAPGDRLPTQRDLAWQLGVTVGTVSRAYAEIERRGLLSGEVGRGTYVRTAPPPGDLPMRPQAAVGDIDLTLNFPAPGVERSMLSEALAKAASDPDAGRLLEYQPDTGLSDHRAAGALWLARRGISVDPSQTIVTAGAQHGIIVSLAALTRPGDRILTERLTYQGVKPAAAMLGLRLEGVAMDEEGLVPEALDQAVVETGARLLYCTPTLQIPTTATMSEARKQAVADVAIRHDLTIIEDDIYGILLDEPAPLPLATFAPEHTIYVTSLSKAVAPGLRIGYTAPPQRLVERVGAAVRASCWMAAPLTAEVATRWIIDGRAEEILQDHRNTAEARRRLATRKLEGHAFNAPVGSLHVWLQLPDPWRAAQFVSAAQQHGVAVAPAETFAAGRGDIPHAIRICLGTPRDTATLVKGLDIVADLLAESDASLSMIV